MFLHAAAGAFGEKTDQIASPSRELACYPPWGARGGPLGPPIGCGSDAMTKSAPKDPLDPPDHTAKLLPAL